MDPCGCSWVSVYIFKSRVQVSTFEIGNKGQASVQECLKLFLSGFFGCQARKRSRLMRKAGDLCTADLVWLLARKSAAA